MSGELEDRGVKKTYGFPHWHTGLYLNPASYLTIDFSKVKGVGYATVGFSAQKAQTGTHLQPFDFAGGREVLDEVSLAVLERTGVEIDAVRGAPTRTDVNYSWQEDSELDVCSRLDHLRGARYPNLKRMPMEDTSVYFRSQTYTNNIFSGKAHDEPSHVCLAYAKSPEIRALLAKKKVSKEDLIQAENKFRLEEKYCGKRTIARVAKAHGFDNARPLTVTSGDFAEAVMIDSYKKLKLGKDVLGKDERAAALFRHFAPNGKIEDREARENFTRLYKTMMLADALGGDNLLPLGIMTESPFYRDKSDLLELGLWSSRKRMGRGTPEVLKGLPKPTERRSR